MRQPLPPMAAGSAAFGRAGRQPVAAIEFGLRRKPGAAGVLVGAIGLLLAAGDLAAFESVATIQKIDLEKNSLHVRAGGRDRIAALARGVQVQGADGKPLPGGLQAKELKEGVEVTIAGSVKAGRLVIQVIRLGRQGRYLLKGGKPSVGLKPLTEMSAQDRYKGEDGGLYGGGSNQPPAAHLAAATRQTARIVPLDAEGKPAKDGKIGLVSISMSNATQEYSVFKRMADQDERKSRRVAIVDCAQGGQAMAQWVNPNGRPWAEADRRLAAAKVSSAQVQVIWVKLANMMPTGELAEHGKKLQKDTLAVLRNAKARFPNVRIAYLASRIYGGYAPAGHRLNPEPYAYEGAFVVRWLIQDQIKGSPDLAYDDRAGPARVPLLLWGPYLWADGTTPRKGDGLTWERTDLSPNDGIHPSQAGRRKVAQMLLKFFTEDSLAATWFVKAAH
jgi:hypothetical protein